MANPAGIDISSYQGSVDWDALYNNVAFALIKATEYTEYIDTKLARNRDEARRVGIPTGFYHFAGSSLTRAVGNADVEADHFIDSLGPLRSGEWLILDWEIEYEDPVAWCVNWFQRVQQRTGSQTKGIFYTNVDRLRRFDWTPLFNMGVVLWVANPSSLDQPYDFVAEQTGYTVVPGISGNVDADIFNADNMNSFKHYGYQPTEVGPVIPDPGTVITPTPIPVSVPSPSPTPSSTPSPSTPAPIPPIPVTPGGGTSLDGMLHGDLAQPTVQEVDAQIEKGIVQAEQVIGKLRTFKVGWKTSEFWQVAVANVATFSEGVVKSHATAVRVVAFAVIGGVTATYVWSRTRVKKAAASLK